MTECIVNSFKKWEGFIMKIGFGCDHAAIDLKNELIKYMTEKGYECVDYGTGYDENGELLSAIIQIRVVKLVKQL